MNVKRITPVLFVPEVEPCVKFWVERFGFETTAEVPATATIPARNARIVLTENHLNGIIQGAEPCAFC